MFLPSQIYKPKDFDSEVESIVSKSKPQWVDNKKVYIDSDGNQFEFDFQNHLVFIN